MYALLGTFSSECVGGSSSSSVRELLIYTYVLWLRSAYGFYLQAQRKHVKGALVYRLEQPYPGLIWSSSLLPRPVKLLSIRSIPTGTFNPFYAVYNQCIIICSQRSDQAPVLHTDRESTHSSCSKPKLYISLTYQLLTDYRLSVADSEFS